MRSIVWGNLRRARLRGLGVDNLPDFSGFTYDAGPDSSISPEDQTFLDTGVSVDSQTGTVTLADGTQISTTRGTTPKTPFNFSRWLSQPLAPGWPSNGATIGIAALGTLLFSMLGRRGRR